MEGTLTNILNAVSSLFITSLQLTKNIFCAVEKESLLAPNDNLCHAGTDCAPKIGLGLLIKSFKKKKKKVYHGVIVALDLDS